jgi:hypothetical protein
MSSPICIEALFSKPMICVYTKSRSRLNCLLEAYNNNILKLYFVGCGISLENDQCLDNNRDIMDVHVLL